MVDELERPYTNEAPLFALLRKSSDGIVILDTHGSILFVNAAAARLFGRSEAELLGTTLGLPSASGEKTVIEVLQKGAGPRTVEMTATETVWEQKPVHLAILHDITREVEAEQKYRLLAQNTSDLIVVIEDGEETFISPSVTDVLGYSAAEFRALGALGTVHSDEKDEIATSMETSLFGVETGRLRFVCRHRHADGRYRRLETVGRKETLDTGKTVTVLNSRDVTERVEAEMGLERALEQKNYLMQELNHRVKNNLAIVTSLIATKEAALDDEVDFSDLRSRIDAIRIVHEHLYQTEEASSINMKDYLEDLLATVFASLSDRHVQVDTEVASISVSTKTAIPLGLIVNEVATNAIKHGFTDGEPPRFTARMASVPSEGACVLTLSNNGAPMPENIDLNRSNSLGLRLTSLLVEQIDGTLDLQKNPSPTFTIRFPVA